MANLLPKIEGHLLNLRKHTRHIYQELLEYIVSNQKKKTRILSIGRNPAH